MDAAPVKEVVTLRTVPASTQMYRLPLESPTGIVSPWSAVPEVREPPAIGQEVATASCATWPEVVAPSSTVVVQVLETVPELENRRP